MDNLKLIRDLAVISAVALGLYFGSELAKTKIWSDAKIKCETIK